jgi:hypothetical protein
MILSQDIRTAFASALESPLPDLALTLTYNQPYPVTPEKIAADLRHFHAKIDRRIVGRNFHVAPLSSRSRYWGVIEGSGGNMHIHVGWYLACSPDNARTSPAAAMESLLMSGGWKTFAPRGSWHLIPFAPGWCDYAMKSLTTTDHIIISDNIDLPASDPA